MSHKFRFFMLLACCTMSLPAMADDEWIITTTDTSVSAADTAGLAQTTDNTALDELKQLFASQDPATNKVALSNSFDVDRNKNPELSYISHPDIAVNFFKTCTDKLKGYVSIEYDKTESLQTRLKCFTSDSPEGSYDIEKISNAQWNAIFKKRLDYGTKNCTKFDSIIPNPVPAPYNPKYGPQLGEGAVSGYLDVNVTTKRSESRNFCYISFPAPIPSGKKIIQINEDDKFAKAKQICEANKGTFVIDDYTSAGHSRFTTRYSLYKFALCIFTTTGDVNAQLTSEPWEHAIDLKLYKDKLPSDQKFNPDNAAGKRCQRAFSGKDIGDVNYLGQALPTGNSGYYTACQFSIVDSSHNGEIFE